MLARDRFRNQGLRDQPGQAAVAVGKHLLAGLIADVERVQHVGRIRGVAGERVGAETVSTTLDRREKCANGLTANAVALHHVSFERDGVEPPRKSVAGILRRLHSRISCRLKLQQFISRLRGNRSAFQLLAPGVCQP